MEKEIVFYDPSSIESTIAAAAIKRHLNPSVMVVSNISQIQLVKPSTVSWLCIAPSTELVKSIGGKHSVIAPPEGATWPEGMEISTLEPPEFCYETTELPSGVIAKTQVFPHTRSLLWAVATHLANTPNHAGLAEYYRWLALMVENFEKGDSFECVQLNPNPKNKLELFLARFKERAYLWNAYRQACSYLVLKKDYQEELITTTYQVICDDYKEYLSDVRSRIMKTMVLRKLSTDEGRPFYCPTINVNQEMMPFALKLMMASYDCAAAYEHFGDKSVYRVYSRNPAYYRKIVDILYRGGKARLSDFY